MFPARLALLGAASLLVLASLGPPAVAQQAAAPAPAVAGPALPIALPPLPQVQDAPWPGVVRLQVDATDLNRRIFDVTETIPVERAGPLVLFFPEWLPGNHGPVGPIAQLAGLEITANGQRVEWVRDTLHPFAFHLEVPQGASEITARFQHLSPTTGSQGRVTMTAEMLNIQWEKVGQKLTTDQTVSDWVGKSVGYFLVAKCIRALRLRHGMLTWDQPRPPRTTVCGARGGTAGAPLADETLKTRGFKNES